MKDDETIKNLMELECYSGLQQKYTVAIHNALYLISHQKTGIEKLEKELTEYKLRLKMSESTVDEIKSEAIKEFAKRLKKAKDNLKYYLDNNEQNGVVYIPKFIVDNLVKKMTEDTNG